ncbi:MAG: hypothetical protein PH343_08515 [Nitrospira sp.]|nr:hypothetical protein [Nitrospira sp.]
MIASATTLIAGYNVLSTASTVMIEGFKILYKVTNDINDFINEHIDQMKNAENPTIARTGRVLEMAKFGFGIGYITSVVVIAAGQLLLGFTLEALQTLGSAAVFSNPIAMTCAAVGAIYYGWHALTDQEKDEIIEKLSKGLNTGKELIKSIVSFIIEKTKEIWNSDNLTEIKKYISSVAKAFGKTLGDVTHRFADIISDTGTNIKTKTGEVLDRTGVIASDVYGGAKEQTTKAAVFVSETCGSVIEQGRKGINVIKSKF